MNASPFHATLRGIGFWCGLIAACIALVAWASH